jgi:hypothetical protein
LGRALARMPSKKVWIILPILNRIAAKTWFRVFGSPIGVEFYGSLFIISSVIYDS